MVIASGSWRPAGRLVTDSESDKRYIDDNYGANREFPLVVVIDRPLWQVLYRLLPSRIQVKAPLKGRRMMMVVM